MQRFEGFSVYRSPGRYITHAFISFCNPLTNGSNVAYFAAYTLSSGVRLFSFNCLKWEGVSPVIFLNCCERCCTLL
jgi:hypothetical protein